MHTSEDSIVNYIVKCEDYSGKRFTLQFYIPKFRDNRFMRLRGNEKIFTGELPLLPISKTIDDTVQIATFYNKITEYKNLLLQEEEYRNSLKSAQTVG